MLFIKERKRDAEAFNGRASPERRPSLLCMQKKRLGDSWVANEHARRARKAVGMV